MNRDPVVGDQHRSGGLEEPREPFRHRALDHGERLRRPAAREELPVHDLARTRIEDGHQWAMLFTFLRKPGVPWNNNGAENAIRQGVLIRKVSGGRRTWVGARVLERLLTVYRTCRTRDELFRDAVLNALMGSGPPLPSVRPQS